MFCPQPHGTYPYFKLIAKKVSATNIFRKKFEKIPSMIRTVTVLRTVPTNVIHLPTRLPWENSFAVPNPAYQILGFPIGDAY